MSISRLESEESKTEDWTTSELALRLVQILIVLLCVALVFAANKCVIQKSFLGDDHVHLVWLREAVINPTLVLRNFTSNWLYAWTSPQCYRPLISVFMFTDYLVWHRNAIGFHITNFVFHLLSCLALYGCVTEVIEFSVLKKSLRFWPLFAACTFALYPNHPEAVSWVTGRVDAVVTTFYLLSVYTWMLWRKFASRRFFCASIFSMILALCSKEMAVTIPLVFLLFEVFIARRATTAAISDDAPAKIDKTSSRLLHSFKQTYAAWILLAAYFLLRKVALGTFIGGYDDSLQVNLQILTEHWRAGVTKLFIPINSYYIPGNEWVVALWTWLSASIYFIAAFFAMKHRYRKPMWFFVGFTAVCFIPVYKLFDGMPDLQGSRFSYLGSAPLSAVFAFGLATIPQLFNHKYRRVVSVAALAIASVYFICAAKLLWINNQPWSTAGHWVATLEKQFSQIMYGASRADHFVFFNIPNIYRGAYVARNATGDIGGHPDLDWKAIEADDKLYELGQSRDALEKGLTRYKSFFWSDSAGSLIPVQLPPSGMLATTAEWNEEPIEKRLKILQGTERVNITSGKTFVVKAGATPVMASIDLKQLKAWQVNFFKLTRNGTSQAHSRTRPSLLVSTNLLATRWLQSIPIIFGASASTREVFALRLIPEWFCATSAATAILLIPAEVSGSFELTIPANEEVLPVFSRISKARYITASTPLTYQFDVSKIKGAAGAQIQTSKRNSFFSGQNTIDYQDGVTSSSRTIQKLSGCNSLKALDFPGGGQYQMRCWAIDGDGRRLGLSSDYLLTVVL